MSGLGRAIGPALTGLAFTWGVENGFVLAPYAFLAFIAALGAIPVFMSTDGDGPTATPEETDVEDDDDDDDDSDTMVGSSMLLPNESAIADEDDEDEANTRHGSGVSAPLLGTKSGRRGNYGTSDNAT